MYNLLTDKLIQVVDVDGAQLQCTLPEVYTLAAADRIDAFMKLRPHQWQPWHCLLVQLGAMAILRSDAQKVPSDAEGWAQVLRALTPEFPDDEPWQLVVDDWQSPAFLQMPSPETVIKDYKSGVASSDLLDMLVTSRNHDLKMGAAQNPEVEDWLFALVSLQTTEGFLGAGNYGISRMNGGFSSRCFVGLSPLGGVGAHITRDIEALLVKRKDICKTYKVLYPRPDNGIPLVYLLPWDGLSSLPITELDPYYVEVCRRVRFVSDADTQRIAVKVANSKKARIDASMLNGNTGDPWAPVVKGDDGKALTLDARGFSYKRVCDLLFSSNWVKPALAKPTDQERGTDMQFVLSAFVRGQGKTEGWQQRTIPAGEAIVSLFSSGGELIGERAEAFIKDASEIQKCLRTAVQIYNAGAPTDESGRIDFDAVSDNDRNLSNQFGNQFDDFVNQNFFVPLWQTFEAPDSEKSELINDWRYLLLCHARQLLEESFQSLPKSRFHRRSQAQATRLFNVQIFKSKMFNGWLAEYEHSLMNSKREQYEQSN